MQGMQQFAYLLLQMQMGDGISLTICDTVRVWRVIFGSTGNEKSLNFMNIILLSLAWRFRSVTGVTAIHL